MIAKEPFIIIKTTTNKASLLKGILYSKILRLQKLFGRTFITHAELHENAMQEKEVVLTITGHDFQMTHKHSGGSMELVVESLFSRIAAYMHKPYIPA